MKTMANAIARCHKGAILLLLVAFAVMDHAHGQNQTYTSLYDAISKIPDYATLKTVVDTANLQALLSNPNLTAILLAPDNTAFQNTLAANPGAAGLLGNQSVIQAVLSYHVLPQTTPNAQLNLSNPMGTTLPTLLSSSAPPNTLANVTFKAMPGNQYYAGGLPSGALLNLSNSVVAGQGRIYTLTSGILVPPSKTLTLSPNASVSLTIAQLVQGNPLFTNLTALVLADPVLAAFATNPDNAVTVFAPPDAAFAALFAQLNTTLDAVKNTTLARRIVLNHIVLLRPFTSGQLLPPNTTGNTAPPLPTAANALLGFPDQLQVTVSGSNATVQGAGNTSPINVVAANIPAGKSVAHVIAAVILPNLNATAAPPGAAAPPTPPGVMAPPGTLAPGAMAPPPGTTPPGAMAPPPSPAAASMIAASTWLLTTLLGAAMLLGFVNM